MLSLLYSNPYSFAISWMFSKEASSLIFIVKLWLVFSLEATSLFNSSTSKLSFEIKALDVIETIGKLIVKIIANVYISFTNC